MPRPKRCRRVCEEPYFCEFSAQGASVATSVEMTVDEYEVVRLVDFERRTHDECAKQMQISRTTVTEIYESARQKLADFIVNGKRLHIVGGNFRLCEDNGSGCRRCAHHKGRTNTNQTIKKGVNSMRIAVTYENEQIFQHFGHTQQFKLYDVADGKIVAKTVVDTDGQGHGALSVLLGDNEVDVLICGGIGGGAQMALAQLGIRLYGGVSGSCDGAVEALLQGKLAYNPDVKCSHHDHEHGDTPHTCGEHGCGKGSCHHG